MLFSDASFIIIINVAPVSRLQHATCSLIADNLTKFDSQFYFYAIKYNIFTNEARNRWVYIYKSNTYSN